LPMVRNAQTGRLPQFDNTAEGIGRMLGAVFPATVFFLAVFLRTAVDPEAKRRLRAALASV
jgi:hypothetical protein